ISLHVPYDKNKGSLIGKNEIEKMKDGVYLINCSRGKVVDEKALLDALNVGKVAGAGIDVFEEEPTNNKELVNHPNEINFPGKVNIYSEEVYKKSREVLDEMIEKKYYIQ
ncbi:NAD(P)-dependent oxidoreductase, partial [Clostridioides difficile]|uniref:NAD(P)-dependent oxidoreductase n=1 Tax=Clostridioides difficile TaxID=1496 RepID=UPI002ABE059A